MMVIILVMTIAMMMPTTVYGDESGDYGDDIDDYDDDVNDYVGDTEYYGNPQLHGSRKGFLADSN